MSPLYGSGSQESLGAPPAPLGRRCPLSSRYTEGLDPLPPDPPPPLLPPPIPTPPNQIRLAAAGRRLPPRQVGGSPLPGSGSSTTSHGLYSRYCRRGCSSTPRPCLRASPARRPLSRPAVPHRITLSTRDARDARRPVGPSAAASSPSSAHPGCFAHIPTCLFHPSPAFRRR